MHISGELHSKRQIKRACAAIAAIALVAGGTSTISAAVGTSENMLMVTAESDLSQASRLAHSQVAGEVFIFIQNSSGSIQEVQFFLDDGLGTGSPISIATANPFVMSPSSGATPTATAAPTVPGSTNEPTMPTPTTGTASGLDDEGDSGTDAPSNDGDEAKESGHDSDMRSFSRNANSGGSKDKGESGGDTGPSDDGGTAAEDDSGEITEIGGAPVTGTETTGGAMPTAPGSTMALDTTQLTNGTHFVLAQITSTTGKVTDLFARFIVSNGNSSLPSPVANETMPQPTSESTGPSAPTPSGNVVMEGDFETGDVSQFFHWDDWGGSVQGGAAPPSTAADPLDPSNTVGKFTVLGGQQRSELFASENLTLNEGDIYTFSFSTLLGEGFPVNEGGWQVLTQWHKKSAAGSPPLSLDVGGGNYSLVSHGASSGGRASETLGPAVPGEWVDWIFRIEFSSSAGSVDVTMNGKPVLTGHRPGTGTLQPNDPGYVKLGYYRDSSIGTDGTVYHDNWQISEG